MAVTDFKAESFLFMVLEVLSPDGNYFEMIVISANFGGKGISIDPGKISSMHLRPRETLSNDIRSELRWTEYSG